MASGIGERSEGETVWARRFVPGGDSFWETLEILEIVENPAPGAPAEVLRSTHVFGVGIDDEVSFTREDPTDAHQGVYWSHRDDLHSLTSVTDDQGVVARRFRYGDYGAVRVMDADGNPLGQTDSLTPHLYTGRPMVAGTGLIDFRHEDLWRFR